MKYANKSSATRAAKREFGGDWESKASVQPDDDGGFILIERQPETPVYDEEALILNIMGEAKCSRQQAEKSLAKARAKELEAKQNLSLTEALAESGESLDDLKDDAPSGKSGDGTANKLAMGWRLSTTEKPTKKVWTIADSMPGASRKDVIAACEAAGIGPGTSRTQYQAWFSAMKASGLNPRG